MGCFCTHFLLHCLHTTLAIGDTNFLFTNMFLYLILEEGGGGPTMTGLLGSGLLFIQQNIAGSCSLNMSWI